MMEAAKIDVNLKIVNRRARLESLQLTRSPFRGELNDPASTASCGTQRVARAVPSSPPGVARHQKNFNPN
jgi:hypothetical protein